MSDTGPPTNPGDIVVVGQRRRSDGSFPPAAGAGGGGTGSGDGVNQNELDPNEPPPSPPHPCDDPATALIWNADAVAAAAVAKLIAKAASLADGSTLSNREFGANLIRQLDGSVTLTDPDVGPTVSLGDVPDVVIQPGGATLLNWMGDIHNHPSGNGALSGDERQRFLDRLDQISQWHPERDLSAIAAYVVVVDNTSPTGYRIYANTRNTPPDEEGKEVNPLAQPCLGSGL